MTARILLVEDDDGIAVPLLRTLEREGYLLNRVETGAEGLAAVASEPADLVLLDLGLPDMDGIEVCRRLRETGFRGGVMILTARGGELDLAVGLDVGADDYLGKPFGLGELLARTRALLRRTTEYAGAGDAAAQTVADPPALAADRDATRRPAATLRVDRRGRRVWIGDDEVALTSKEFDLLSMLELEAGAVVRREQLMSEVWDENWFGSTRTLDVTMSRLRLKLDDAGAPVKVVTVRGVGFRLEPRRPDDA
ncbi:response regulator transcription factor [Nocardioides ferulae]|uniref:response regulator transcription factor n=1 Tax=Nocardioides ferulae TaxID=2340821 RepID=UPI000EB01D60|nr:response regulator transcription factor [Nocardioides ferulae]